MKLASWQQTVSDDPHRFKLVTAGRRSGKTYLAVHELCRYAVQPQQNVMYCTSSYRAAKMIVWKQLKERLLDLRWAAKINESELSIELVNKSVISLKGSENIASLRGIRLDFCVIDEAAFCDPDLFPEVIRPALADRKGHALFISTPAGKSNYFYDLYTAAQANQDWQTWQLTTLESGMVDPDEIEAAKADMSESQFRQEFEASWEDIGNRVSYNFTREQNVLAYSGATPKEIICGIDFNLHPMSCSIMTRSGDTLHCIDEIEIFSSNTDELAKEIKHRYPTQKIWAFPDPSGSRSQTSSAGRSDHVILANAGLLVKAPRKHDPVKDRINAFNARCKTADGNIHFYVDPTCKRTIECLEKHSYKPGTSIPDKDSGYDHLFDAVTYAVAYLFPVRKPAPQKPPQSWGTKVVL